MRDSENLCKALFDQAAVGVVLSASNGRWLRVNQKLCDILGYDESELVNLGFRPITHSEDVDSDLDFLAQLKAGEIPFFTEEKRFIHKDGSIAWVFITVSLVHNADGDPDYFITIIENIWRRARIREELRRSEERFRDIALSVSGVVYQFRLDTHGQLSFPYVSPTLFEITGLRPEDVMADANLWIDTIHPDDRAGFEASIERSAQSLESWTWEGRMFHASGELWWIHGASVPQRLDDGSVLWNGLAIDITKQKLTEVGLRESEASYRELFDESPVAIWVEDWSPIKQMLDDLARGGVKDWRGYFDNHRDQLKTAYDLGKILDISHATVELYREESKEHLMRMTDAAVVIDEELDAFLEMTLSFLAGQVTVDIEAKDMAGDGSEIIVRRRVVIPPKYHGDWSRVIFAMEDVTERKRAQEALRDSEKRLTQAQRLAMIGHAIWDEKEDRLVSHSEVLDLIWGTSAEEIFTRFAEFLDTVHPDDRERVSLVMEQAIKDRTDFEIDYRIVRPDGETRVIHEIAEPEFDKTGRLIRTVSTVQDITERERLEEQLREAHKLKALGQLTGGVAHEFNNLLQAIVGSLDIILQAIEHGVQDTDRVKQMIELAQRSAFGGKELTGRLLSYVGKHPVMPEILDVGEFVSDAVDLLEPMLGETIEIETQIADDFWPIEVDRKQLELALLNLALNARDAMADGGRLTIEATNVHIDESFAVKQPDSVTPGDYVKLAITDTGTGMSPEVRGRVFDPFYTTKDVGKGTGLGLSMVYGFIVRQSGGFVDITSSEGRGTTVALYLPRAEAKKAEAPQLAESSKEPSTGAGTILVVEDNPEVLRTAVLMLEDLGYTVHKAKDAAEALTVLQQAGVIDLLLSDVTLPGGTSGIELADTLRHANPATKVIVMSGYPEDKIDMAALSETGVRLLKKPFRKQTLASAIEEALGNGGKHAA